MNVQHITLLIGIVTIATLTHQQQTGMKCTYGDRGSLTANCYNATATFFRQTTYRFDSLDETVRCTNCNLQVIESGTFDISGNQILTLDLRNSKITTLKESSFLGLVFLKTLYLQDNKITSVYPLVFKGIKKLEMLHMQNNSIIILGENAFAELIQLRTLDLSRNLLKGIDPKAFSGLTSLQELYLSNNLLHEVGDILGPLRRLETLTLNYNLITNLKRGDFSNLTNLNALELNHNNIKQLSNETFHGLHSLSKLFLDENQINDIDTLAFESLSSLESLSLADNQIAEVKKNTFLGMLNLRDLQLANNSIANFTTGLFNGIPELRNLDLSNNRLQFIRRTGVLKLHSLSSIDLSFNNLTDLDYKLLHVHMPRLSYLKIIENPWPCYLLDEMKTYFEHDSIKLILDTKNCRNVEKSVNQVAYNEMLTEEVVDNHYAHSFIVYPLLIVVLMMNAVLFYLFYRREQNFSYFGHKSVSHANLMSNEQQREEF